MLLRLVKPEVEDCIKGYITVASRREDESHTVLVVPNSADADAFQNNGIMRVYLNNTADIF